MTIAPSKAHLHTPLFVTENDLFGSRGNSHIGSLDGGIQFVIQGQTK